MHLQHLATTTTILETCVSVTKYICHIYIYENSIAFCSHNHIRAYVSSSSRKATFGSSWHPYYLTLKWL